MFSVGAIARGIRRNIKRNGPLVPHNHKDRKHGGGDKCHCSDRKKCKHKTVHIYWGRLVLVCASIIGFSVLTLNLQNIAYALRILSLNIPWLTPKPVLSPVSQTIEYFSYEHQYQNLQFQRVENMKKYAFHYNVNGIDKRSKLSLQEFTDVYDGKWPVLITDVVPKWPAMAKWTKQFITKKYGKDQIYMKISEGKLHSISGSVTSIEAFSKYSFEGSRTHWKYLEDELFISERPELKSDIGHSIYMTDDMYKLFPDEIRPWNAMFLWGTPYSRSSLHMDPYNWTGTNAVLWGRKIWKLYPPEQDELLYARKDTVSGFPLNSFKYSSPIDAHDPDFNAYPKSRELNALQFEQQAGELLIIPSGWFHQAFNVEETLAISSQVMNSANYLTVLEEIFRAGNIPRTSIPHNWSHLTPEQQVKEVIKLLPKSVLEQGQKITQSHAQHTTDKIMF